jgi:hypothetical protein
VATTIVVFVKRGSCTEKACSLHQTACSALKLPLLSVGIPPCNMRPPICRAVACSGCLSCCDSGVTASTALASSDPGPSQCGRFPRALQLLFIRGCMTAESLASWLPRSGLPQCTSDAANQLMINIYATPQQQALQALVRGVRLLIDSTTAAVSCCMACRQEGGLADAARVLVSCSMIQVNCFSAMTA